MATPTLSRRGSERVMMDEGLGEMSRNLLNGRP